MIAWRSSPKGTGVKSGNGAPNVTLPSVFTNTDANVWPKKLTAKPRSTGPDDSPSPAGRAAGSKPGGIGPAGGTAAGRATRRPAGASLGQAGDMRGDLRGRCPRPV